MIKFFRKIKRRWKRKYIVLQNLHGIIDYYRKGEFLSKKRGRIADYVTKIPLWLRIKGLSKDDDKFRSMVWLGRSIEKIGELELEIKELKKENKQRKYNKNVAERLDYLEERIEGKLLQDYEKTFF